MDPLSLTASVIAVIGAASRIASGLKRIIDLRKAPAVLLALNNEVSDLQLILAQLESLAPSRTARDADQSLLQNTTLVKAKLQELEIIIYARLIAKSGGLNRAAWLLAQDKVETIRKDIRLLRVNISNALHVMTHAISMRIETRLEGLENFITAQHTEISTSLTTDRTDLSHILERLVHEQQSSSQKLRQIQERFEEALTLTNLVEDRAEQPQLSDSKHSSMTKVSGRVDQESQQRQLPFPSLARSNTFRVRLQSNRCKSTCDCSCHRFKYGQTLSALQNVLGSLFVGYRGFPALSGTCTVPTCRGNATAHLHVDYFFPRWILHKAVRASLTTNHASDPELCIRLVNIRPHDAEIFRAAFQGDADTTRKLLTRGQASVRDVESTSGHSPLHIACMWGNTEVIAVLLQFGADMYMENMHHEIPYDMAWSTILCFENTPNAAKFKVEETRTLFPSIPFLADHRGFSVPHQIVTGSIGTDLRLALEMNPGGIDAQDANGRTPLHWACARGDAAAVKTLLGQGADPNMADDLGQACLRASLKAADTQCATLLVGAGAELHARDHWRQTPLLASNYSADPVAFGLVLLGAGADVNDVDDGGSTALMEAVRLNNAPYVRILLDHGARTDVANKQGHSPVQLAVQGNRGAILEMLATAAPPSRLFSWLAMPEPPATMIMSSRRGTILHVAAEFGETPTLEILCAHCQGQRVDAGARNAQGKTALDIARGRGFAPRTNQQGFDVDMEKQDASGMVGPDWMMLFSKLMDSCSGTTP